MKTSKNGANKTLRKTEDFIQENLVSQSQKALIEQVETQFSFALTPTMLQQIKPQDNDPVARQFVPSAAELDIKEDELSDPIGDDAHTAVKGIIHRYPDRCLFKPVHVCPVYCRFCFRREKVGPGSETLSPDELERAYEYIRLHPEIWEVILTGGDPLILKPKLLGKILKALEAIDSVEVLRIHTRVPIVSPERINTEMLAVLKSLQKPLYLVIHANHANEFTPQAETGLMELVKAGVVLLSQSVLLKGINDDIESLSTLMRTFIRNRIKPYYLHQGDQAKGTSHFRTTIETGQTLMRELRGRFSGICQPTYVLDIPGGHGKVPINSSYIQDAHQIDGSKTCYCVQDYQGKTHTYHDERF